MRFDKSRLSLLGAAAVAVVMAAGADARAASSDHTIVLTQIGCQFLESENGVDHGYQPTSAADCNAINAETAQERLAEARVLELEPGTYVFEVTNKNVPYELGFWLREPDYDWRNPLHKLTKTSVSGGGLLEGQTQRYEIELEPGEYIYSCPLNPTPNYRIVVKG